MTDKELAEVLNQWFVDHRRDTRYNSNPVWKVLKYRLYMRGNWKDRPRGDPRAFEKTSVDNY